MLGAGERRLRVDDPVATAQLVAGLETDVSSSSFPLSKTFDELPTEQP